MQRRLFKFRVLGVALLANGRLAAPAPFAAAASNERDDGYVGADCRLAHAGTERNDRPRDFPAADVRQSKPCPRTTANLQVHVVHAAGGDANEDLAVSGCGVGNVRRNEAFGTAESR